MYLPPDFREDRVEVLHELIGRHGFATLVTLGPDGLTASHLPMEIDPHPAPFGTLRGHLARANPQWTSLSSDAEALAIFTGPQSYVSPSWYATKRETGRVVPTWNYIAVHAYGPLETFEDPGRLRALVSSLTDRHERGRAEPWTVDDAPEEFIERQLKGIVGIEMPISRLEGKWKLSQNRGPADREGVVRGLRETKSADNLEMADLIARLD